MNTFAKAKMVAEKIAQQHLRFLRFQSSHLASHRLETQPFEAEKETASDSAMDQSQPPSDPSSPSNKSVLNRLLVAHYNFCLLAFKLGKKEKAAIDWIAFRFKIPNFYALSSPLALTSLKKNAEDSLKLLHKDSMVHDSFVCLNGEIPNWQLLQLDIHLLSLATHLHVNVVVV